MKNLAGRACRVFVLGLAGVAAGCTGGSVSSQPQIVGNQPRIATYRCGEDGGSLRIINTGAAVVVSENAVPIETGVPEETRYELVAAPPNQRSRYGADGLALVIEGREALWMKAGDAPLTCIR